MNVLFVLLPAGLSVERLLANAPSALHTQVARLRCRQYPPATDLDQLATLVLTVGDPAAVIGRARSMKHLLLGASSGLATGLAYASLIGGPHVDLPTASATGLAIGSFLAMNRGTSNLQICTELQSLLPNVRGGDVLVSWAAKSPEPLHALRLVAEAQRLPTALRCDARP